MPSDEFHDGFPLGNEGEEWWKANEQKVKQLLERARASKLANARLREIAELEAMWTRENTRGC